MSFFFHLGIIHIDFKVEVELFFNELLLNPLELALEFFIRLFEKFLLLIFNLFDRFSVNN